MTDPTIFDHVGGSDALHRLAAAQYRRCLTDPVLVRVFGTEGRPGHVEHLAAWLGEVFGGPNFYTRDLGGHGALLRRHANLAITEEQRQHFVQAFMEAADDAGLPSDARFRRRFREYIEWGSRIALAISKPGADTTTHEPVPHWGWE